MVPHHVANMCVYTAGEALNTLSLSDCRGVLFDGSDSVRYSGRILQNMNSFPEGILI